MWHDITLLHRRTGPAFPESPIAVLWQTCLRKIMILPSSELSRVAAQLEKNDEIYSGEAAVRFLVEICAGLHSPILGETEVFGQFRQCFRDFNHADLQFQKQIRDFFEIVSDTTKRVREQCLRGAATNSYGSFARKLMKNHKSVSFLGAGQLAAEILPWLESFNVDIHARSPEKIKALLAKHPSASGKALSEPASGEAVILAAPLTAQEITAWLSTCNNKPKLILDLRGESATDPLPASTAQHVVCLQEFFHVQQANEAKRAAIKLATTALLNTYFHKLHEQRECRPFGWEDVCV